MSLRSLTAAACGAAAGLGFWATLGSIDRMQAPSGAVRVAMLPSVGTLVLSVAAGALLFVAWQLAVIALARRAGARESEAIGAGTRCACSQVARCSCCRSCRGSPTPCRRRCCLPGPAAGWRGASSAALAAWALAIEWRAATRPAGQPGPPAQRDRRRGTRATTTLDHGGAARQPGVVGACWPASSRALRCFPGGDEPHYLVIAQSLWRDGDLRIENNHTRGDYQEYFHRTLTPHYLTRGVDRQIYSIHPIGMPVLMTPVYALGGYDLVVYALLLLAAIAMTSAWRLAWAVTGSASAATFAWAVLALGPPWIFNTFAVYPEVPAACAVALAFAWTSGWHAERDDASTRRRRAGAAMVGGRRRDRVPALVQHEVPGDGRGARTRVVAARLVAVAGTTRRRGGARWCARWRSACPTSSASRGGSCSSS